MQEGLSGLSVKRVAPHPSRMRRLPLVLAAAALLALPSWADPQWIWTAEPAPQVNSYVRFRTTFAARDAAVLEIAAAGSYAVWVNGVLAAFGQFADTPEHKTFSREDISPHCRKDVPNELLVEVFHSGDDFTSHVDGPPGLWARVVSGDRPLVETSSAWQAQVDARYSQGRREKLTGSLNWNLAYDARAALPPWRPVRALSSRRALSLRPIAALPLGVATEHEPIRESCRDGVRTALYDLGEESTGIPRLTVVAAAGAEVELRHAEYVRDGAINPAAFERGRSFVDRFVCAEGTNDFFHPFRRWGGRYFEVRVRGASCRETRVTFAFHPVVHDWPTPPFACSDPVFEKAHEISARTLRLCHHEKYENCPWREQSICAYDARNQMLFGYGFWGNYAEAEAMLTLFAQCAKSNGFVRAAAPMARELWIPAFTFMWMLAIDEHCRHAGSDRLFVRLAPQLETMLERILDVRKDGLWTPPEGAERWDYGECVTLEYASDPPNAFYNLYLFEALRALAPRFRQLGRTAVADRMESALAEMPRRLEARFWDASVGLYADRVMPDGRLEGHYPFIQVLSLHAGIVPEERVRGLLARLRADDMRVALPTMPFLVEAVHRLGDSDDKAWLHARIREMLKRQIDAGATTWWEDQSGTEYGAGIGSLCHGWSAFEAWYETEYLLSGRYRPEGMSHCRGQVMTHEGVRPAGW